jgi:hypothetical protein
MRLPVFVLSTVLLAIPTFSVAVPDSRVAGSGCPHLGGYIDGPFVPTAAAARGIYIAIRNAIAPSYRSAKHATIIAEDKIDHWEVYQRINVKNRSGQLVPLMGGAGLGLYINKCTGAISHAAYSR